MSVRSAECGIRSWTCANRRRRQAARVAVIPHSSLRTPHSNGLSAPHSRSGISLLEVLISIFILSVGMLSIASLLPVGGYQAQKATIEDRKSVIGQNAFHEFRTRGMANAENWLGFPLPPGQTFPKPVSVAIDPLMFTSPTIGGNASKQFPRASANASTAPAMSSAIHQSTRRLYRRDECSRSGVPQPDPRVAPRATRFRARAAATPRSRTSTPRAPPPRRARPR